MTKPLLLLRVVVAALFVIHAVYRIWAGIVDDFGQFLSQVGWPQGLLVAWLVTVCELLSGLLLMWGVWLRLAAGYLLFQCLMGIWLVHAQAGWFVVGGGRNGMEYSVLLITCLLVLIWSDVEQTTPPNSQL